MSKQSFLDSYTSYNANSWNPTDTTPLSEVDSENFPDIESAEVTEKEQTWGMSTSICLTMKGNLKKYINLSSKSNLEVGDQVDVDSLRIITLEREGDEPIFRIDGDVLEDKPKRGRR